MMTSTKPRSIEFVTKQLQGRSREDFYQVIPDLADAISNPETLKTLMDKGHFPFHFRPSIEQIQGKIGTGLSSPDKEKNQLLEMKWANESDEETSKAQAIEFWARVAKILTYYTGGEKIALFAVYDGHSTKSMPELASQYLCFSVAWYLMKAFGEMSEDVAADNQVLQKSMESATSTVHMLLKQKIIHDLSTSTLSTQECHVSGNGTALVENMPDQSSFCTPSQFQYYGKKLKWEKARGTHGGTTVSFSVVTPSHVIMSVLGDSPACIVRRDSDRALVQMMRLQSMDHLPYSVQALMEASQLLFSSNHGFSYSPCSTSGTNARVGLTGLRFYGSLGDFLNDMDVMNAFVTVSGDYDDYKRSNQEGDLTSEGKGEPWRTTVAYKFLSNFYELEDVQSNDPVIMSAYFYGLQVSEGTAYGVRDATPVKLKPMLADGAFQRRGNVQVFERAKVSQIWLMTDGISKRFERDHAHMILQNEDLDQVATAMIHFPESSPWFSLFDADDRTIIGIKL